MINTYQTSLAPPPVPPRHNRSPPVLIPTPVPSQSNSRPLIRFLVGVVVLHLVLSVGGFFYLYHIDIKGNFSPEGKVAFSSSEKQETFYKTSARMVVERPTGKSTSHYLQWNTRHSVLKNINYYEESWLTIPESGDYYVYSRVTFSKGHQKLPLSSEVKLRKTETAQDMVVMQAYCYLDSNSTSPRLCTATQGEVLTLEKGNQLSVWVIDPSLVNYQQGATTFGMYKV